MPRRKPAVAQTTSPDQGPSVPEPRVEEPLTLRVRTITGMPRRRAGLAFGPERVEIDATALTDDQVEALIADTALEVVVL